MTSVHDRPSLQSMLSPGRKTLQFHRSITLEIHRLDNRGTHLTGIAATSGKEFARALAEDQAERVSDRLQLLLGIPRRRGSFPRKAK